MSKSAQAFLGALQGLCLLLFWLRYPQPNYVCIHVRMYSMLPKQSLHMLPKQNCTILCPSAPDVFMLLNHSGQLLLRSMLGS
jgi:hypothetical protein